MRIILPPSETKLPEGCGDPLDYSNLSFPSLTATRKRLVRALVSLGAKSKRLAAREALGLSVGQDQEIERNVALRSSPTTAAVDRYTGVLFDALDAATLKPSQRESIWIASALFGVLAAEDPVPAYRLSATSRLPGLGTLASIWKPKLALVLGSCGPVLDLRSGSYVDLGPVPDAFVARVIDRDGRSISHHNKATKGRIARVVAGSDATDLVDVADLLSADGMSVLLTGDRTFDVTT